MRAPTRIPAFRTRAKSLMTLTFTAYSPNGTTTDPNGYEVPAYVSQGTTKGKIQGPSASTADSTARTVAVGGVVRTVLEGGLHLPVSAPLPVAGEFRIGWEYLCTAVGPYDDPTLLNRRYLVVGVPAKSFATARRLDVVQIS